MQLERICERTYKTTVLVYSAGNGNKWIYWLMSTQERNYKFK